MTPTLSYRGTIAVLELGGDEQALTAMTMGHRYGGPESDAVALVDDTASEDELLDVAVNRLTPRRKRSRHSRGDHERDVRHRPRAAERRLRQT